MRAKRNTYSSLTKAQYQKVRKANNPEISVQNKIKQRIYRREDRMKVLSYYGGICECCGEWRYEFLTIDHVNNNGAEHRRQLGRRGNNIIDWIVKNNFPEGIQVLCYNCNCSKGQHRACPHL